MRPSERHTSAADPDPAGDALVWPMPVADADILWLEPAVAPAVASAPALAPVPAPKSNDAGPTANPKPAWGAGISLAQIAAANVPMEWHDAVAVVSQLADHVLGDRRQRPTGALPPVSAIRLEPDGQIHLRLEPNGSEPLPVGFGRVLQALLQDKPTPANLRLLAWRTSSEAGASLTLDEIVGELARWERPGRIGKLKDLYERARAAGPALPTATSSPAPVIPQMIQPAPAPAPAPDPEPAVAVPPRWRRRVALLAGFAILGVAAGGAGVWLLGQPAPPAKVVAPAATAAAPAADPQGAVEPSTPRRGVRKPARAVPQPRVQSNVPRREGGRSGEAQQTASAAARNPPAAPAPAPERSANRTQTDRTPASPPSSSSIPNLPVAQAGAPAPPTPAPPPSAAPDRRIYKTGEAGVTDAILVKPYLPPRAHPDIPDTELGVLEVVVDTRGLVETVHLRSPANRYREKWWLFTAKDWRFEPARKNGTPVRFLKKILLTDLNITEPQ